MPTRNTKKGPADQRKIDLELLQFVLPSRHACIARDPLLHLLLAGFSVSCYNHAEGSGPSRMPALGCRDVYSYFSRSFSKMFETDKK